MSSQAARKAVQPRAADENTSQYSMPSRSSRSRQAIRESAWKVAIHVETFLLTFQHIFCEVTLFIEIQERRITFQIDLFG